MPPKGKQGECGKGKGKGKCKQKKAPAAPRRTSPRKKKAAPAEDHSSDEESTHGAGAESDASQESVAQSQSGSQSQSLPQSQSESQSLSKVSKRRRKEPEFPIDIMRKIASFYEGNPMFYDVSHESHKDTHLKDTKLLELSAEINVQVEDIMRHFTNMRTDHFKLKNAVKTTPSGSGAAKVLTPLQHLKVHGYSFLDPFYRPRTSKTDTCGKIAGAEGGDESGSDVESESVSVATDEGAPSTSRGTSKYKSSAKPSAKSSGVQEVLLRFLEKSAESAKQADEKVQAMREASQKPESAAWADWLVSIQSEIPENLYRQYQADSFALGMRYLSGQVQPTPQPQPQPQPQPLAQPQQQYITLSAIPPRVHQQQQPQFATQLQYPARALSAPAPAATSFDSLLKQAWDVADTMTSPLGSSLPTRTSMVDTPPAQQSTQSTESLSQLLQDTQRTLHPSDSDNDMDRDMARDL